MEGAFGEVSLAFSKILDVAISTPPHLGEDAPVFYICTPPHIPNLHKAEQPLHVKDPLLRDDKGKFFAILRRILFLSA